MPEQNVLQFDVVPILSMRLGRFDETQCVRRILASLASGRGGWVVTANVDILRRHAHDPAFRRLTSSADIVVADGMPLVWASIVQGSPLPARVAGSNLITSLSAAAASAGRSVFLLGGDPGTAESARAVLLAHSPQLQVAGTWCPPLGFEHDPAQVAAIRAALQQAQPDIIFVALGSPKQEWLIRELRDSVPSSWWLGIGISFSFLAGRVKRAPPWVQRSGFEWLHRLWQEPRRLAHRYLVDGLPFAAYLLAHAAMVRMRKLFLRAA
jgi:N-acetylglucosaminyldiphosphoundecaprenol N-acetyl-beta-D-mannosaminyltransferase